MTEKRISAVSPTIQELQLEGNLKLITLGSSEKLNRTQWGHSSFIQASQFDERKSFSPSKNNFFLLRTMWCLIEAHFVAAFPLISRRRFWLLKIWSWLNVERWTKTSNTRSLAFRWIRIKHHLSCCSKYVHLMYMKLTNWMTDWLSDRSNYKQTDRQTDRPLADQPTEWPTY